MLTQSYATSVAESSSIDPASFAEQAAHCVKAAQRAQTHTERRRQITLARDAVSDLRKALESGAFNESQRSRCKQTAEMLHDAAVGHNVTFSLVCALMCLEKIAGR